MAERHSPDPELIKLGAGSLYLDVWDALGAKTGMRHIGNVDTLETTTTPDILTIRSNMTANRPVRKKIVRATDLVLRAVGDEWSMDNIALLTMGDKIYRTATAVPVVDKILFANVPAATLGSALGGKYFHVGDLNIGTVVLELGAATLVLGTDYTIHSAPFGLLYIMPTSAAVTNGTNDLQVTYTPQAITGTNSPVVRGATRSEVGASLLFLEDNSAGENHILRVWRVSITPDGAFGLISEEKATFALNMTIEDDTIGQYGGTAANPLYEMQLLPPAA